MSKSSVLRVCVVLGLSASLLGCVSGAAWTKVQVAPSYQAPKELKVALVAESTAQHTAEAMAHLKAALSKGLASKGINATFVDAPTGGVESTLTVVDWNQGSRALRAFVGFGSGEGSIVVVVKSPSADGQAGLDGTARGFVKGGTFGGSSYNSAVEAGHFIAKAIATGEVK